MSESDTRNGLQSQNSLDLNENGVKDSSDGLSNPQVESNNQNDPSNLKPLDLTKNEVKDAPVELNDPPKESNNLVQNPSTDNISAQETAQPLFQCYSYEIIQDCQEDFIDDIIFAPAVIYPDCSSNTLLYPCQCQCMWVDECYF